jgi:hypothetical protein
MKTDELHVVSLQQEPMVVFIEYSNAKNHRTCHQHQQGDVASKCRPVRLDETPRRAMSAVN